MSDALVKAIDDLKPSLTDLFERIAEQTGDEHGISRASYGEAETAAGESLIAYARERGLDAGYDRVGNATFTAPGQLDAEPEILIGSHLDSVPRGGNYDGLAGVVAGIGTLVALKECGSAAQQGLRVLGFRGEESPWFGTAYLGSKLFTGQLSLSETDAMRRSDTGRTLTEHLDEIGVVRSQIDGKPAVGLDRVRAYLELHIEQGPVLVDLAIPVAIATAIRGNIRYPFAKCYGSYAHSAAVPRRLRADAMIATAKLITFADEQWRRELDVGHDDLVFTCGICHTDSFTLSGDDPEGIFPSILGHEGAGVVVEVGPGVTSVEKGDHVIPLYTPECRQCKFCLSGKTNLCQAIRETQGRGVMPDGTSRFSMLDGTPILHYMGCSTFANHTVLPEIALAKINPDAPFDKVCYIGCGVTTGLGAVMNTAKVEIGSRAIVFGLGGIGLNVIQGLRMAGADQIVGVDLNPDKRDMAARFGMTDFVNPAEVEGDLVAHLVALTKGGADYTFDATGNVQVMRTALEAAHKGWGESIIIGVAPAGAEISTRPFQLVTGRVWRGTAFGGARGRTDVPKIVDWYMDGKVEIDPMITHVLDLEDINTAFDLMHSGESIRSVVVF